MSQVPFQFFDGRRRLALVFEKHEPPVQVGRVVTRVIGLGLLQKPFTFGHIPGFSVNPALAAQCHGLVGVIGQNLVVHGQCRCRVARSERGGLLQFLV